MAGSGRSGSAGGDGHGTDGGGEGERRSGGGTGLPAGLEAAWGLRGRPAKGPKRGLSLERIVEAAVRIAASEGLEAVSMGRVAKELGAAPMSLYRYVGAKGELYVLMLEAAMGPPPEDLVAGRGWREGLERWAFAMREGYRRNLWALRVPVHGPPASPNAIDWWEQGLRAMEGSGLDEGEKISVILLVSGFVRNELLLAADLDAGFRANGVTPQAALEDYARTLAHLVDPDRHPAISRMLRSGVMNGPDDPDFDFTFGLGRVLDGVEVLVARA
ncbi:TetR/AcrR family transcriptional regulator (plasmid) [Streptomyces sp. CA-294286]|uniref:TetR/AcrR family transcriptional regulator n=1 Tax=Streptomyces sp. CA-294286 TaxID=3240070 RepID=UPI003D8EF558